MFEDWDLPRRIDEDLQAAIVRRGADFPEWPQEPPVTIVAIARKEAIEEISRREKPPPPSWIELAERMWADAWLDTFIRSQIACRAARDESTREGIVACVKVRLYYVILSNAGKWYRRGDHNLNWRGFVICQVPQLTRRCADESNPPDREQPRGDGGPGGGFDGGSPLDYLRQSSELPPDIQAELQDLVEIVASELSEEERQLFRTLFLETPRSDMEIADELEIDESRLKQLKSRLKKKLLRMFGAAPRP